ncbi:alpha/beta hydrolase [Bacillus sp. FJAT-42376]|nr:alpha/beta hydrolase [Bacillus sp. FJAT-42376]
MNGRNMHVYTKGNGHHTIVLWSGLGTAAPALDFEPLVDELAKNNRVAVVEPFGYGWSDLTKEPRTVENIVEEMRAALTKAYISGPYIIMPHSVSGIYSMYYSNKYPEEVEAVIGIDALMPQALEHFGESAPSLPEYVKYAAPTGVARLAVHAMPNQFLPLAESGAYSNKNLTMTKAISSWKSYNRNVVDETKEIRNNIYKTDHLKFPPEIPVLLFVREGDKVKTEAKTAFYQTQLSKNPSSKIVPLKGHHYLHWTRYKEMSSYVNEFIKD